MTVLRMKFKQTTCMKTFKKTKASLILANVQKIKKYMAKQTKKIIGKMRDETKGFPIVEFADSA